MGKIGEITLASNKDGGDRRKEEITILEEEKKDAKVKATIETV